MQDCSTHSQPPATTTPAAHNVNGDGADAGECQFALSVHLAHVSIGGGRATALRAGDLILLHTVLILPAAEDESVRTTAHAQLQVVVPPDLPEGAAVSVDSAVQLPLTPAQLVALRACSDGESEGTGSQRSIGGLEVRVFHQPRTRVFGESGFKEVGQLVTVGVGLVDLQGVWAASRWTGSPLSLVCRCFCLGRASGCGRSRRQTNI